MMSSALTKKASNSPNTLYFSIIHNLPSLLSVVESGHQRIIRNVHGRVDRESPIFGRWGKETIKLRIFRNNSGYIASKQGEIEKFMNKHRRDLWKHCKFLDTFIRECEIFGLFSALPSQTSTSQTVFIFGGSRKSSESRELQELPQLYILTNLKQHWGNNVLLLFSWDSNFLTAGHVLYHLHKVRAKSSCHYLMIG